MEIRERLKVLAAERGTSVERLMMRADLIGGEGARHSTVRKALKRERPLTRHIMEALAEACGVSPEIFDEYRLAVARDRLDETLVGLDEALRNLEGGS